MNFRKISTNLKISKNTLAIAQKYVPSTFFQHDFKTPNQVRPAHTDIPKPNFQEYRTKHLENPNALSSDSVDNRRAMMSLFSFVGGIGSLYCCKAHLLQCVLFFNPARDVLAVASTSVTINDIPEGKTMIVKWRGKPIFITHRTQQVINTERAVTMAELRHPETDEQRVQRPEWLVVVGICTHLGCVPIPNAGLYPGGYFCPCHGTHFDGSGRTRKGPAPTNMEVPTYKFMDDNTIFIG